MFTLKVKRNLGYVWPSRPKSSKIVLLYHSIGNSPWATTVEEFDKQMNWLNDHCSVLSLTDLIQAEPKKELQIAITFDDGYQSLYDHAASILANKKMSATVYLNTGWIGENSEIRKKSDYLLGHYPDEFFLTWPEVKSLYESNWIIGSHGVNHLNFAETKSDLTCQELFLSKQDIENKLGIECEHFAYPWGRHSLAVKEILKQSKYRYAVTAKHGSVTKHVDLYEIPRINISNQYSFQDFKNIVKGKWDYLGLLHRIKGL